MFTEWSKIFPVLNCLLCALLTIYVRTTVLNSKKCHKRLTLYQVNQFKCAWQTLLAYYCSGSNIHTREHLGRV